MTDTIQSLLRQHVSDPTIAVKYGGLQWTWSQYLAESAARAAALITIADPQRPTHIGSLLGNTPEMLAQLAAAGLGGYVLCGLNTTRRGDALAADVRRADCQIVVTDADHRALLDGLDSRARGSLIPRHRGGLNWWLVTAPLSPIEKSTRWIRS